MHSSIFALLAVLFLSSCATAAPAKSEPLSVPAPGTAVSIEETVKTEYPLAPEEKKPLTAQFKKALSDEEKSFDLQESKGTKEFKAAQSQQVKDWRNQERKTRRTFFDAHLSGPERREYVQSYITRKKEFDQRQKDDFAAYKLALKEKHDVLKSNHKIRSEQFKASVDRNVRPSKSLWTQ
jgi:hypothetical protein